MARAPRIDDRPEMTLERGRPHAELVHVRLSNEHGASVTKFCDHLRVLRRNPVMEMLVAGRRSYSCCVIEIFDGDRQPMQRAAPMSGPNVALRVARLFERKPRGHRDESI